MFILKYFPQIEKLQDFHLRLIDTATTKERSLILYPAAHGKTTLVSTLLPIWALCCDPNTRIAIIAKNEVDAKGIMRAIHAELQGNEDLMRDFGPFHDPEDETKAWAIERIDVAGKTTRTKEGSIQIYGSGGNVLGKRFDWAICDDVVTEKNSATPEQRYKVREWFNLGVETMPEFPDSRLTVVGTLFDPEDLYHDIVEMTYPDTGEEVYHWQREDAIVDEEAHSTLWEEKWPWKRLMQQKAKMGTLDFNKRYRNIAVDRSRMVFKEAYVKGGWEGKEQYPGCLDKQYKVGDYDPSWARFAGFDPAVGLTRSAKFCAHVTLASGSCFEHEHCLYVVDLIRDQMTLPQQADLIIAQHAKYGLLTSKVEANSYQGGLVQVIDDKMKDANKVFRIEPHYTHKGNKWDPEIGIQAMVPWLEAGKVHIPWGDLESRRKMQQLVDELVEYPGRTTDTVLALWFAWLAAEQSTIGAGSFNRLHNPRQTMYGQIARRRIVKNPVYQEEHA